MTYHQDWSVAHPVAINPRATPTPVYISLEDAVERCADAFAPGSPSREWVRGWLATGQPLAGMRLIKARPIPTTGPCPCECNSGGFCGGCGHAGCGGRRGR